MNLNITEITDKLQGAADLCRDCADSLIEKVDVKEKKDKICGFMKKKVDINLNVSVDVGVLIAIGAALLIAILILIGAKKKK